MKKNNWIALIVLIVILVICILCWVIFGTKAFRGETLGGLVPMLRMGLGLRL